MQSEVTRAYFDGIKEKIRWIEQNLGSGSWFNDESVEQTALATAQRVGHIQGLTDALEIDIETVIEGE